MFAVALKRGGAIPPAPGRKLWPQRSGLALVMLMLAVVALLGLVLSASASHSRQAPAMVARQSGRPGLPPLFVENRGQVDRRASFYFQGREAGVFFTRRGLALSLIDPQQKHRFGLRLDFLGVGAGVRPVGEARTHAIFSYFQGRRADWKTGVPTFSMVAYRNLWPGIDLLYSGQGSKLKYSFLVRPGADPAKIRLGWRGASGVALTSSGQLKVSTPARTLLDDAPISYQSFGGRRTAVQSSYALGAGNTYGFRIGTYDHSQPLVVDPAVLVYSGFIGGKREDSVNSLALDANRNIYIDGPTTSPDFPVKVGPSTSYVNTDGQGEAFVAKVNPAGTGLVYAGFIGAQKRVTPFGLTVDKTGAVYVGGSTCATENDGFPVTVGPDLTYNGGPQDGWVAKINPAGTALVYAGYIGGAGAAPDDSCLGNNEQVNGVAVDSTGHAYVAGFTKSHENTFPNGADGGGFAGGMIPGYQQTQGGLLDAFVVKVKPDGSGFDYGTFLGGGGVDAGTGINVDAAGNAYVNVFTGSNEMPTGPMNPFGGFPVTTGAFNTHFTGPPMSPAPSEVAEVKLDPTGTHLIYSTYIGGAGPNQQTFGISNHVDRAGNVYISGATSADQASFPTGHGFGNIQGFDHRFSAGVTPPAMSGVGDAFVVKLNRFGSALDYATYIGGSGDERGGDVDVDAAGNAYISGSTSSSDGTFPSRNGPSLRYHGGPEDAFVAKLNPTGTVLDYAGFIGGSGDDSALGMKVDSSGNAYIAGTTSSDQSTFATKVGPRVTKPGGLGSTDTDAFVVKIADVLSLTGVRLTNKVFVVGAKRAPRFGKSAAARRHKRGTTFRFSLSEPATVGIVISERLSGRRSGKRCVAATAKLRRAATCTGFIRQGTLTRTGHQGTNRVAFSGRIGSKALKPGRYQATLIAGAPFTRASKPAAITFTIVTR